MAHHIETLPVSRVSRRRTISPPLITVVLIVVEFAAILCAAWIAAAIYHAIAYRVVPVGQGELAFGTAFATLFSLSSFFRDDYRAQLTEPGRKSRRRLLTAFTLTFAAVIFLGFLTKTSDIYSRGAVIVFFPLALGLLLAARGLVHGLINQATRIGWLSSGRVLVVGQKQEVSAFLRRSAARQHGYDVVGVEHFSTLEPTTGLDDNLDRIVETARWRQPDTILLALPWSDVETIDRCVRAFMKLPVRVELTPERVFDRFDEPRLARIGALLTLNVLRPPLGHSARLIKRFIDLVLATLALVLLAPLFAVVAVLIRRNSPGPILFRQTRYGFNQQPFRIWKFRTMHTTDDGAVVRQASRDDDRITAVGKWLRRWNIDELPQLLNVIAGEMSLVGPRPHAVAHNQIYENRIDLYARRHNVLPGITGWAQVNGYRGATDDEAMQKRVEYDLYYLDNWSLGLDLAIIIRTVISRRSYRNAY